jgi:putative lipoic acid-binding regulatory protein
MQEIPSKDLSELVDFPCDFSIKAIGKRSETFAAEIVAIFKKRIPEISLNDSTTKPSKGDKYLSVTVKFRAKSADHVKALYADIQKHPSVVMCL